MDKQLSHHQTASIERLSEFAVCSPLEGVIAFSTLRTRPSDQGRVEANYACRASDPEESRIKAQQNRAWLQPMLPSPLLWFTMEHGTHVCDVDRLAPDQAPPSCDGLVTSKAETVLSMLTADCMPVMLIDQRNQVLGLAHAGWRGLQRGILETTVTAMKAKGAVDIQAWIGPSIRHQAFEVGQDVFDAFTQQDASVERFFTPKPLHNQKWLLDFIGIASYMLHEVGVQHVTDSGLCSHAQSELFFSYRRQQEKERILTVAWMKRD